MTSFSWTAIVDDRPFFTLRTRWVADATMPGWECDNDWIITVEGDPAIQATYQRALSFDGGIRRGGHLKDPDGEQFGHVFAGTTAGALLNAIPGVCAAPAGHFLPQVCGVKSVRRRGATLG